MSSPLPISAQRRRSSAVSATQLPSGRRASLGGATPNLASSSINPALGGNRRGSLKDLAAQREMMNRAALDQKESRRLPRAELRDFLSKYTVADLRLCVGKGKLIEIDGSLKPVEGFEILLQNNIEAAPVYTKGASGDKEYSGFLDIRDLLSSIVYVYTQPIDEDALVYTQDGGAEIDFVPSTHGLDGIADLSDVYRHANIPTPDSTPPASGRVSPQIPADLPKKVGSTQSNKTPSSSSDTPLSLPSANKLDSEAEDTIGEIPVIASQSPVERWASLSEVSQSPEHSPFEILNDNNLSADTSAQFKSESAAAQWEETIRKGMQKFGAVHSPTQAFSSLSAGGALTPNSSEDDSMDEAKQSPSSSLHMTPPVSVDGSYGGRAAFKENNVITLTYLSRRNPFKPVTMETSLLVLAELFARGQKRVAVVEPPQHKVSQKESDEKSHLSPSPEVMCRCPILDIISQVAVIEFMMSKAAELHSLMKADIERCDLGTRNVVTIKSTEATALDAFALMDEMQLTGLAIVDEKYCLMGATSSRDVKRLAMNKGRLSLNLPVMEYLLESRRFYNGDSLSAYQNVNESDEDLIAAAELERELDDSANRAVSSLTIPSLSSSSSTSAPSTSQCTTKAFTLFGSLCLPFHFASAGDVVTALSDRHTNRVFLTDEVSAGGMSGSLSGGSSSIIERKEIQVEPVRVVSFTDIMRLATSPSD